MNVSRRHVLRVAGRVAPLAVLGIPPDAQASMTGRLFDWLNSRPVEMPRAGEDILAFAARVVPEVTANDAFYVQSIGHSSPGLSRRKWRLNIKGEIKQPFSATFSELGVFRQEKTWATMTCIGNPVGGGQIGNALWQGIPLKNLIEQAGIAESVRRSVSARVIFRAADGYHDSISMEQALYPRTLLCTRMNGNHLPRDHGAP